jgi:hypothetical protein
VATGQITTRPLKIPPHPHPDVCSAHMLRLKSMGVSPSSNVTDNGRLQEQNRSTSIGEFSLLLAATLLHFAQVPMVYGVLCEDDKQWSSFIRFLLCSGNFTG